MSLTTPLYVSHSDAVTVRSFRWLEANLTLSGTPAFEHLALCHNTALVNGESVSFSKKVKAIMARGRSTSRSFCWVFKILSCSSLSCETKKYPKGLHIV